MYISYETYSYREKSKDSYSYKKYHRCGKHFTALLLLLCVIMISLTICAGELLYREGNVLTVQAEQRIVLEEQVASPEQEITVENSGRATSELVEDRTSARQVPLIVLDPGHGGADEGCSRAEVLEKDINLEIARLVKIRLVAMGYDVVLTRERDECYTLEERVNCANNIAADIYISIHQNACEEETSKVCGAETWYARSKEDDGSKRLAQLIQQRMTIDTQVVDRGVVAKDSLYVVRETHMPAVLVETGFLSNRKERELLTTTEYREQLAEAIADAVELYFHPKTMYLTFDDGPSPDNTERILDILKEKNIQATFFLVGENVEKYPEIAKRIVEEGHTIGIHCNSHDYQKIYADVDSYLADFEEAYRIIQEVTGVDVKLFRFPGGSINSYNKGVYRQIIAVMTKRGFVYYDWNASLEDAVSRAEPELLIRNARESTLGRKKVVMLAHDIVPNTVLCLEELLEQFPEYAMKPLTEEVAPIQF